MAEPGTHPMPEGGVNPPPDSACDEVLFYTLIWKTAVIVMPVVRVA